MGQARPCGHSTALHLLGQQVHASKQSEHPFWNLGRKCTPHPHPGHSLQESWVMKVFPAILYRTESHLTLLSLSVEEAAVIGPPPPRANELPGPALWHQPSWLQASKPVTFLFYLHMVFASFDVDSYTQGRRDFSKNSLLSASDSLSPHPFLFPFQGSRNC